MSEKRRGLILTGELLDSMSPDEVTVFKRVIEEKFGLNAIERALSEHQLKRYRRGESPKPERTELGNISIDNVRNLAEAFGYSRQATTVAIGYLEFFYGCYTSSAYSSYQKPGWDKTLAEAGIEFPLSQDKYSMRLSNGKVVKIVELQEEFPWGYASINGDALKAVMDAGIAIGGAKSQALFSNIVAFMSNENAKLEGHLS